MKTLNTQLIIDNVRDIVGDNSQHRYKDDHITRLIRRGVKDFTLKTEVYRVIEDTVKHGDCPFTFKLRPNLINLTRVTLEGIELPLVSRQDMDRLNPRWEREYTKSKVTHIVYDMQNKGIYRLYPLPTKLLVHYFDDDIKYGVLTIPSDVDYGLFHDLSNIKDTSFCKREDLITKYGELIELDIYKLDFNFFYTAQIEDITLLNLEWEEAITRFVTSNLLRYDRDDQNRTFGKEEYRLYLTEVSEAKARGAKDFTRGNQYTVHYKGMR